MLLVKGILAALIVISVPTVARLFGPKLAGMIMLVPVITILSLTFVGREQGTAAVARTAHGGLIGLIPLAVFLLAVAWTAPRMSLQVSLGTSFLAWCAMVALMQASRAILVSVLSIITMVLAIPALLALPRWLMRVVKMQWTPVISLSVMTIILFTAMFMDALGHDPSVTMLPMLPTLVVVTLSMMQPRYVSVEPSYGWSRS